MRRGLFLISMAIVVAAFIIPSGTLSAAEFPSISEIFGEIDYPDIGIKDIFGYAQDLLTDPSAFESVLSLSGFVDFLGDTFSGLTESGFSTESIAGIAMVVCLIVIVLSLVSALIGKMRGKKAQE